MTERNERIVTGAVVVAAAAAAALCGVLTLFVLRADRAVFATAQRVDVVLDHGAAVAVELHERVKELQAPIAQASEIEAHAVPVEDAALARVNELQAPLAESRKVVHDSRLTLDNVNRAAIDERMYFEQQVPETMRRVDAAVDGLLPVETNAAETLRDANAVVANPAIPALLTHADEAMAATGEMARHGDATAGDVQQAVHGWLHPSWKTRATNWVVQAGGVVAGLF